MIDPSKVLSSLPSGLRDPLVKSYQEISKNYAEHRWEPAALNGGKFSECVYTIAHGYLHGTYATHPTKPANMIAACRDLEKVPFNPSRVGDQSMRILIPRMLLPLYEIRNNRGVGHVGGEVDPNYLDSTSVFAMASWILAELVRIFHSVSTAEAQAAVDMLVERKHPLIWEVDNTKRVLAPHMDKGDQTLLLLHTSPSWISESDLLAWVEYSSPAMFKTRILRPFHKSRLVEYEDGKKRVRITPLGVKEVETRIIKDWKP